MKNKILIALMSILILAGCSASKKGHWSEADRDAFKSDMNQVNLSAFGTKKQIWLDLYYKKLETNYDSYTSANNDVSGCKKLALQCNNELYSNGSVKGKWSQFDKDAFVKDMASIDLSAFAEQKESWIQCYLEKLEAAYGSYYEANCDEVGCKKAANACTEACLKK